MACPSILHLHSPPTPSSRLSSSPPPPRHLALNPPNLLTASSSDFPPCLCSPLCPESLHSFIFLLLGWAPSISSAGILV
ncbi:hypothetical protein I3842_10G079300 [Carya illinoinensis]|uniref:Uncharacterized protein n=1 Tax=Carya illinoinensis TaxID=32201 RepID=A0A922J4E3_CARIL|nr:hypothetical protein I3842_10G079300 [Carya illinoinensis]